MCLSSIERSTARTATRPPKLLVTPRASSSAMLFFSVLLGRRELRRTAARRQKSLRPVDHHENQDQPEHHALVFRRLELRRNLAQVELAEERQREHHARLADDVEPNRQGLSHLPGQGSN